MRDRGRARQAGGNEMSKAMRPCCCGLTATDAEAAPPAECGRTGSLPELVIGHRLRTPIDRSRTRPAGRDGRALDADGDDQRFAGQLAGGTLDQWLPTTWAVSSRAARAPPGVSTRLRIEGRPALDIRVDCPRNPATASPKPSSSAPSPAADAPPRPGRISPRAERRRDRWAQGISPASPCAPGQPNPVCRAAEAFDR